MDLIKRLQDLSCLIKRKELTEFQSMNCFDALISIQGHYILYNFNLNHDNLDSISLYDESLKIYEQAVVTLNVFEDTYRKGTELTDSLNQFKSIIDECFNY